MIEVSFIQLILLILSDFLMDPPSARGMTHLFSEGSAALRWGRLE